jgi:putative salt-induced outer membrane protein
MNLRSVVVCALLLAAPFVVAQEEEAESPWAGKATLGYLATSGNTDNSTLNSSFEISYSTGDWKHLFGARAINATEDESTTAEAYEAGWKSERNFSEHNYMFGQLDWRRDRFSGYETQFSQTVGYGRRLIDKEAHKLNVEIGAGARQSKLADVDGSKESETILRAGLGYTWQISETAVFTQDFKVESGDANTYSESKSALSATLVGNLALVASYTIKNNSDVPVVPPPAPPIEKTDTYTALSLEYAF